MRFGFRIDMVSSINTWTEPRSTDARASTVRVTEGKEGAWKESEERGALPHPKVAELGVHRQTAFGLHFVRIAAHEHSPVRPSLRGVARKSPEHGQA